MPNRNRAFIVNTRAGVRFFGVCLPGLSGLAQILAALVLLLKGYRVVGMRPMANATCAPSGTYRNPVDDGEWGDVNKVYYPARFRYEDTLIDNAAISLRGNPCCS